MQCCLMTIKENCCMAAGAPAAFQSENTGVRPPIIDVNGPGLDSANQHFVYK